jgi:hypothetical protein
MAQRPAVRSEGSRLSMDTQISEFADFKTLLSRCIPFLYRDLAAFTENHLHCSIHFKTVFLGPHEQLSNACCSIRSSWQRPYPLVRKYSQLEVSVLYFIDCACDTEQW